MWAARNKGSGDRLDLEKFPRGAVPLEVSNGLLKFHCDKTWLLVVIVSRVFLYSVNKILSVERLPCVLAPGNPHVVPVSLTLTWGLGQFPWATQIVTKKYSGRPTPSLSHRQRLKDEAANPSPPYTHTSFQMFSTAGRPALSL